MQPTVPYKTGSPPSVKSLLLRRGKPGVMFTLFYNLHALFRPEIVELRERIKGQEEVEEPEPQERESISPKTLNI